MQISLTFDPATELGDVQALLDTLSGDDSGADASAPSASGEKPKRRRGKKAAEPAASEPSVPATPAPATPAPAAPQGGFNLGAATPAGDPLAALLGGAPAGQLPPAPAPAAAAPAPAAATPAPAAAASALPEAAPTQQQLLQAFTALAQAPGKGPAAMSAVLKQLGAATVVAIPPEKYGDAMQLIRQALA